jgi:predicted enzyme related to lactoylglutathione lyase
MNIIGTDFVLFHVGDMQKAIEFYRDFLGLPLEFYKEEWKWAEFSAGNVTLTLSGGGRPSTSVIALAVDDLEAASHEVQAKGVKAKRSLHELSTCWHLEILDPDGNTVILHKRKDGTHGQD